MLLLRVEPAEGPAFDRAFDGEEIVVGRSSQADLALPDRFLSRLHARVSVEGERAFIEDLGSRNGTVLNGRRLERREELHAGDVVQLSASTLTVLGGAQQVREVVAEIPLGAATVLRPVSDIFARQESMTTAVRGEMELRRQAERLRILNEVHRVAAGSASCEELLELILDRLFDSLRPEEGVVLLRQEGGEVRPVARRGSLGPGGPAFFSRTLVDEVVGKGQAALVLDVPSDERFAAAQSVIASGVRSLIAAPLVCPEGALGMVVLSSRASVHRFSEEDMELLAALAAVAALRIWSLGLAERAAEHRRLEGELALARRIQVALLPAHLPEVRGVEVHAGNLPSRGVSGDLYEVIERRGGEELVLLVADVSGKGMAASLLTAALEALAAVPIAEGHPPDEICRRLSEMLFARTPPEKYATLFLTQLDTITGRVRYVNAGHNPALLLRRDGRVELLEATGLPIGMLRGAGYRVEERGLEEGDLLVIYTDGITEAADATGEEYGLERLRQLCHERRHLPLPQLAQAIEADLGLFVGDTPVADDRTLLLIRRRAEKVAGPPPTAR